MKNLEAISLCRKSFEGKNWRLGAPVSQKRKELGRNGLDFWNQRGRFSLKRLCEQKRGKKFSPVYDVLYMVYFRHLEFKMADDVQWGFLRTFGMLFSMGLRCYEPIFSLVIIFSTFIRPPVLHCYLKISIMLGAILAPQLPRIAENLFFPFQQDHWIPWPRKHVSNHRYHISRKKVYLVIATLWFCPFLGT